ncbi:MAG: hypothetical protein OD815_000552 [Candidatus Alkanophagales archaeon MCA70_species_2]|nr:hypothetical protein [Candidatus Alkanophaga liquidiphilum]
MDGVRLELRGCGRVVVVEASDAAQEVDAGC